MPPAAIPIATTSGSSQCIGLLSLPATHLETTTWTAVRKAIRATNLCRAHTDQSVIADAASLTRTVLIQDRQCVGHRYRCSGGQAVWWIVRNLVEILGPDGRPLKVIQVEPSQESVYQKAAA